MIDGETAGCYHQEVALPDSPPLSSAELRSMLRIASSVATFAALLLGASLCAAQTEAESMEYFETHIRPLFVRHCYHCHSERADDRESGLLLDNRDGWFEGGERGPSVVAGEPDKSLLIQVVRYEDPALEMPPSEKLSRSEIERLETWVRMGAVGPKAAAPTSIQNPADPEAGRSHWAFVPLTRPVPPKSSDKVWPRTAIDRFVLAKLEEQGLQPVDDADRIALIRRLSLVLSGLPPRPEDVEVFCSDDSSDALERLVDKLIEAPTFGQRWGRHWLDLARYADTNGLDENFLFREAWRYRNWVVNACNADMPYDRFLIEQIAGDLLPYDSIEQRDRQRIAAGFLVIGPKVLLGIDKDKQRMDVADEHLDTIGKTVFAQTLGCARCHDHKFDPIPTADYYALAGIFSSTSVMETRHMLGQQRLMEQLVGLGEDGDAADAAYEQYWRTRPAVVNRKQQAEAALKLLENDKSDELAKLLAGNIEVLAEQARHAGLPKAERIAEQKKWIAQLAEEISNQPSIPPRAMIPFDIEQPQNEAIRVAGEFDVKGETVPRGFLTVLLDRRPPEIPEHSSGRLELARWMTDGQQRSGQLAARVMANRVWHHLFGRGLVRTVDNFGRTGDEPTHPELLDYLAAELIDSDWSIKSLIRTIVLSRTFGLSSEFNAANDEIDPENLYLWRGNRRRLEPEALRDAMLFAAGTLDFSQVDSTVNYLGDQATAVGANKIRRRTDFPCRSLYLPMIRNDLPEIFEAFDFANPHTTTGARPNTIVPKQGLFLLNDDMVMTAARATAQRVLDESSKSGIDERIARLFGLLFHREPDAKAALQEYLQSTEMSLRWDCDEQAELEALARVCHALFASSRFQFAE